MENKYYQCIFAVILVIINLSLQCLVFINWNWNLTAIIRFLLPVVLFKYLDPIAAMIILEGVLDSIEPEISRNNIEYHTRDKILDLWGWTVSIIALWTTITNPILLKYRNVLTILFIMRAIGNIMFIKTRNRRWLACCPNLYSIWFIILPIFTDIGAINKHFITYLTSISLIKMSVEYIHHGSSIKERIKPFRKYTKWLCPGKATMYRETGTFPVDKIKEEDMAPLFI